MRYVKAQDILPPELLDRLQQYVDGAYLYIPRKQENRLSWGERTHSKTETARRNREIYLRYLEGQGPGELAGAYFLTEKTVRRIILEERKAREAEHKAR